MKQCSRCKEFQPLSEFTRRVKSSDGLYSQCKSCVREYRRTYYERNADSLRARTRRYSADHRELLTANKRAWRGRDPFHTLATYANFNAKRSESRGIVRADQVRARVEMYGEKCWVCGGAYNQLDHVIPLGRGGLNLPSNIRPICDPCNSAKWIHKPGDVLSASSRLYRRAGLDDSTAAAVLMALRGAGQRSVMA